MFPNNIFKTNKIDSQEEDYKYREGEKERVKVGAREDIQKGR